MTAPETARPPLRMLAVLAHPDDESLGFGGAFAAAVSSGVETHLVTATRGERGRIGDERPGAEVVGPVREAELMAAARVLGIRSVELLGFLDGELAQVDPRLGIARVVASIRRLKPDVVLTFGPEGGYGHPDHIAVSSWTGTAVVAAADARYSASDGTALAELPPHRVSKLYWLAWTEAKWAAYRVAFGDLVARVDGEVRRAVPWPAWAVTTVLDTAAHWEQVWQAVSCHRSQVSGYRGLVDLPAEHHRAIWGVQEYFRVISLVPTPAERETDLFAGLR